MKSNQESGNWAAIQVGDPARLKIPIHGAGIYQTKQR
jgi:hypothetical protein